jgi:hypothetical protein
MDPFLPNEDASPDWMGLQQFSMTPSERALFYAALHFNGDAPNPELIEEAFSWCDQQRMNTRLIHLALEGRALPRIEKDGLVFRVVAPQHQPKLRQALSDALKAFRKKYPTGGTESSPG